MVSDFKDKVAVVTGASRSIGRGIALALAKEGCDVIVNYRKSREEAFLCTQVAARHMVERGYGKIVNISSNSGFGIAMDGETSYAVSKAGVIQLTKSSAYDLGPYGINVNCVAPGAVDTVMLKGSRSEAEYERVLEGRRERAILGITGKPEDIANAVLFFADDKSHYITGKTLLVDGGRKDFL